MTQDNKNEREEAYQRVIKHSLGNVYKHLEQLINSIDGQVLDNLDPQHRVVIDAVRAVEEEWVLDRAQRRELSLLDDLH